MHRRIELDRSDHELDNRLKLCAFFILLHFIHHAQSIYILSSCRIRLSVSLVVWFTDDISCSLGILFYCLPTVELIALSLLLIFNAYLCFLSLFSLFSLFLSFIFVQSFVFAAINWLRIISIKLTFVVTFYHYNREWNIEAKKNESVFRSYKIEIGSSIWSILPLTEITYLITNQKKFL